MGISYLTGLKGEVLRATVLTKLGFTAEEQFLRRIHVIKAALAHLAKVLWCHCLCLVCVQLTGTVVGTNVVMDLHDL